MATDAEDSDAAFGTYAPGPILAAILRRTARPLRSELDRRVMFALRRIGTTLLGSAPADVERLGCRLRLYPAQNTAEKRLLFTPHLFDAAERDYLAANLKPGFTFADIGANAGGYALAVAAMADGSARILAVEPQPDIFARLTANIGLNRFAQVATRPCAVSDQDGAVTLHINTTNKGESSILGSGRNQAGVTVMAYRLGRLLDEAGFTHLDALKLDVEGVEDRILTDFFATAPRTMWPTILIVEDAPTRWRLDVPRLIEANDYSCVLKTATNRVYRRG